jgi:hypothetical protein
MLHNIHVASMLFQVFQVFRTNIASISFECCICFCNGFQVFLGVSDVCCKCFSSFKRTLQVFSSGYCKSRSECYTCYNETHLLQTPIAATRAPPWVIVRGLGPADASQARHVTRTHVGFPVIRRNTALCPRGGAHKNRQARALTWAALSRR